MCSSVVGFLSPIHYGTVLWSNADADRGLPGASVVVRGISAPVLAAGRFEVAPSSVLVCCVVAAEQARVC